jgi:hypothetical protein
MNTESTGALGVDALRPDVVFMGPGLRLAAKPG